MKFSPTETFNGRNVFIIGATGFVGKVALSMLLDRFPGVGRVYVTVRARGKEESETRFWNNVITAPPVDPVRERYGAAFEDFIRDKVRLVNGDISEERLGFTEEEAEQVAGDMDELPGVEFSAEQEIRDCAKLAERVKDEARDALQAARFRELARKRLYDEGRDPDDLDQMGLAVARERKLWTRERLTELGTERAVFWGWPNIYTYTKSLGEQLVAAETGIVRSIVRPSIVESAMDYPFPGWNEGFTTTAPIIFIALKGQTQIPVNEKLVLDITPVDQVAAVMLAVAAEACVHEPRLVYQAATGDSNPNDMRRIVGMLGLYKRKHFQEKETGFRVVNEIAARMETRPVTPAHFDRTSTPMINAAAKKVSGLLDRVKPRWGGGRVSEVIDQVKQKVDRFEELT